MGTDKRMKFIRALLGMEDSEESSSGDDGEEEDDSPPAPSADDAQSADSAPSDVAEDVKALQSQVNDLETDTETNDNRLDSVQNDMDALQDDLEEVESHIRDLLGVYDALSARVNPLVDGELANMPAMGGEQQAQNSRFDLAETDNASPESTSSEDSDVSESTDDDDKRTLDDLKEDTGMTEDSTPDPTPDTVQPETASDDHHHVATFAGTYASEVVAYQWLSELLELSGVSGTLRALSYYHDIGWISADVKTALQRRLAGADFDGDARQFRRLRADDHADSLAYVIMLEEMEEEQFNN